MKAPSSFTAATNVRAGKLLDGKPQFIRDNKVSGARARGLSYEGKALKMLEEYYGRQSTNALFLRGPWLEFYDDSGKRWCQPDAIAVDSTKGSGVIYEVKYQHTSDAWLQIWRLYEPVLRAIFPVKWEGCEICRWFDPAIPWPESPPTLTPDPLRIPRAGRTAIYIWRDARDTERLLHRSGIQR